MNLVRLILAAGAAILLVGCGSGVGSSASSPGGGTRSAAAGSATAQPGSPAVAQPVPPVGTVPTADQVLAEGPGVQRNAKLGMQVKHGGFDTSLDQMFQLVQANGGFVSGSTADTDTGHLRNGVITFQVPETKFQDSIDGLRKLGTVQHLNIGGNDVTFQYIDLQARLKNAQAQRDAMLALLAQAKTTAEIIQIQNQLGTIQGQVEQLQGQINYLDHSTQFSTISVTVSEAPPAAAAGDDWGFKTAVGSSLHQFVATIDSIIVALGAAGPFLLIALLGGFFLWRFRPRQARATS